MSIDPRVARGACRPNPEISAGLPGHFSHKKRTSMNSTLRVITLAALLLGFGRDGAFADVIVPDDIAYASRIDENGQAKICEIVLTITNSSPPERVDFTTFAGYDKLENAAAVGFLMGAAKQSDSGELELVPISSGAFNSATFNSPDEMDHEVSGDGTIMAATADSLAADRFLESVGEGDFYLTLASDEPEIRDWTYKIASRPPADVQQSFATCLEKLLPSTVSLRRADRNHLKLLRAAMRK